MRREKRRMLKGMDHFTINIKSRDESFWFYGDILGLEKMETIDLDTQVIHYYQLPGTCRLELIEYLEPGKTVQAESQDLGIYRHMAFLVDDLDIVLNKIRTEKIPIVEGPAISKKLGTRYILIEDPNHVEIEFVQRITK